MASVMFPDGVNLATSKCRSCSHVIVWRKTEKGHAMPYSVDGDALKLDPTGRPLSHFADCPQGKGWTGKTRASADAPRQSSLDIDARLDAAGLGPPRPVDCNAGRRDADRDGWYCVCGFDGETADGLRRHVIGRAGLTS